MEAEDENGTMFQQRVFGSTHIIQRPVDPTSMGRNELALEDNQQVAMIALYET